MLILAVSDRCEYPETYMPHPMPRSVKVDYVSKPLETIGWAEVMQGQGLDTLGVVVLWKPDSLRSDLLTGFEIDTIPILTLDQASSAKILLDELRTNTAEELTLNTTKSTIRKAGRLYINLEVSQEQI
jgi:hypothetical protein